MKTECSESEENMIKYRSRRKTLDCAFYLEK